jgi:sarcosine oxidase gamma subunit
VIVQERADATRVFVRPSFAGYLLAWFDDASR